MRTGRPPARRSASRGAERGRLGHRSVRVPRRCEAHRFVARAELRSRRRRCAGAGPVESPSWRYRSPRTAARSPACRSLPEQSAPQTAAEDLIPSEALHVESHRRQPGGVVCVAGSTPGSASPGRARAASRRPGSVGGDEPRRQLCPTGHSSEVPPRRCPVVVVCEAVGLAGIEPATQGHESRKSGCTAGH